MKIKRFDCSYLETYEEPDGEFVKYSDTEKILKLLKFAQENSTFVTIIPDDTKHSMDYCMSCGELLPSHTKECKVSSWTKEVREILKENL